MDLFRALLVWFVMLSASQPAWASSETVVNVALGRVTEIVFAEPVAKVIKGGVEDSVLVEVLDTSVYVLPKSDPPAGIIVTGVSGQTYPLSLQLAPQHDVRITMAGSRAVRLPTSGGIDALALMKEILLGRQPAGATVLKMAETFDLGNPQIKLSVNIIYDFPHLRAYVLNVQNQMDVNVVVPLQQIIFPKLKAAAADFDLLKPKGQVGDSTTIYLVTGK